MDFLIWATRTMHFFAMSLWIGGTLYQAVIILPRLVSSDLERMRSTVAYLSGFLPFIWTGLMTTVVTGLALMMFSPRFMFFSYHDWWSVALGLKQVLVLTMTLFTFGYMRMLRRLTDSISAPDEHQPFLIRMRSFHHMNVVLGIVVILLSGSLN
jgi:uncharacterized membrane protein